MIEALALLLGYQLVGETIAYGLGLPIPGPVVGMALLLVTLALRPTLLARMKGVASTLLSHLSLLFVPAGVGVMVHFARLEHEGFAIVAAIVGSTFVAIVTTAATASFLMRRASRPSDRASTGTR